MYCKLVVFATSFYFNNRYVLCWVSWEDVEQALIQVLEAKGWDMDERRRKPWCPSNTSRLRVMARHVQQARTKKAKWSEAFKFTDEGQAEAEDDEDQGEAEDEKAEGEKDKGKAKGDFIVGWDPGRQNAWKMTRVRNSATSRRV